MNKRDIQRAAGLKRAREALQRFDQGETATDVAKSLGVSRMTLYRDVQALAKLPAPDAGTDPLLDGFEPVTPEAVTDSDIDPLLA
jgi:predicted DNA-binding transcriptional regulator YafY